MESTEEIFTQADYRVLEEHQGEYDAYTHDIATVTFYFGSPTVFEFKRKKAMTDVGFMSQVKKVMKVISQIMPDIPKLRVIGGLITLAFSAAFSMSHKTRSVIP